MVTPRGTSASRRSAGSRVESTMPTCGNVRRKAQISCTSSRSPSVNRGANPPAAGRRRGRLMETMRLPAVAQEMIHMRGERGGFLAPIVQPEQRAQPEPPETGRVGALGTFEPPVEVALGTRRVHLLVGRTVVRLLVNDQPLGSRPRRAGGIPPFPSGRLRATRRAHPPAPARPGCRLRGSRWKRTWGCSPATSRMLRNPPGPGGALPRPPGRPAGSRAGSGCRARTRNTCSC